MDDPGSDSDRSGDVERVRDVGRDTVGGLGQRCAVGIVVDRDGAAAENRLELCGEVDVVPPEVGSPGDRAVVVLHEAGHCDSGADDAVTIGDQRVAGLRDEIDQLFDAGGRTRFRPVGTVEMRALPPRSRATAAR